MTETGLTADQILCAAEDVLRRYGPAKATVMDIARALGVSHGSVYRHFSSKTALREAVTERWLKRTHAVLASIAEETGPADDRLYRWLATLFKAKRGQALDDPELFATYAELPGKTSDVVREHIRLLIAQIASIVSDGARQGIFSDVDATASARAVLFATARFHDPHYAVEWSDPQCDADFEAIWALVRHGIARRN